MDTPLHLTQARINLVFFVMPLSNRFPWQPAMGDKTAAAHNMASGFFLHREQWQQQRGAESSAATVVVSAHF